MTVTTDLTALLAAIVRNPEDDVPRLMFADALMERGEPGDNERAEFIREDIAELSPGNPRGERRNELWETFIVPYCEASPVHNWYEGDWWNRGFVEQITCTAATFLRHADELLWHPGQTVECPACVGSGSDQVGMIPYTDGKGFRDHYLCSRCAPEGVTGYRRGTGRVPRPIPPTAQPITKVVLTTWPDDVYAFDFVAVDRADPGKGYTSPRWSGVKFELPGTGTTVGTEVVSDDAESDYPPMDADEAGVRYT